MKKRVIKEFEIPEVDGRIKVQADISKVSYRMMTKHREQSIGFLKKVKKDDREKLMECIEQGRIGGILSNIDDISAVQDLLSNAERNVKLCVGDSLVVIENPGADEERFEGDEAWNHVYDEQVKWIADQCMKVNPELFNPHGHERKKKE